MRIGYFDYFRDLSVQHYFANVQRELADMGAVLVPFKFGEPLPDDVDLYWDPRLTGTTLPTERFLGARKPCVVTLHDGSPLSLFPWEYYDSFAKAMRQTRTAFLQAYRWRRWRGRLAAIITVSKSAKKGIERSLRLKNEHVLSIYHGLDHELFTPAPARQGEEPFLLHVSQYQPIKNLFRLFSAYARVRITSVPKLVVVSPRFPSQAEIPDGVELIREALPHDKLAELYRSAMGFVFPSLHETFGMPILEAMACGCPVITSNAGACAEVAGNAAILVNPRRVGEIEKALVVLIQNAERRVELRKAGIKRARTFTWRASAEAHLEVFRAALEGGAP